MKHTAADLAFSEWAWSWKWVGSLCGRMHGEKGLPLVAGSDAIGCSPHLIGYRAAAGWHSRQIVGGMKEAVTGWGCLENEWVWSAEGNAHQTQTKKTTEN